MHDACTVFCGHIVTQDNTESLAVHFNKLVTTVFACKHFISMCLGIVFHKRW